MIGAMLFRAFIFYVFQGWVLTGTTTERGQDIVKSVERKNNRRTGGHGISKAHATGRETAIEFPKIYTGQEDTYPL